MVKRPTHRPSYEWIRTLAVAELPHHADGVRPEFWKSIDVAVSRMQPHQRKVYDLYRCGVTIAAIAILMGWQNKSVYKRLAEIDEQLRGTLQVQNPEPSRVKRQVSY